MWIHSPSGSAFLLLLKMLLRQLKRVKGSEKQSLKTILQRVYFQSVSCKCSELIGMKQITFQLHKREVASAFFTLDPVWIQPGHCHPKACSPLLLILSVATPNSYLLLLLLVIPICSCF